MFINHLIPELNLLELVINIDQNHLAHNQLKLVLDQDQLSSLTQLTITNYQGMVLLIQVIINPI